MISIEKTRYLLNWLHMSSPILRDRMKVTAAISTQDVAPIHTYFPITHCVLTQQPPKPRYFCCFHATHDSHNRVRHRQAVHSGGTCSKLSFFKLQPNTDSNTMPASSDPMSVTHPGCAALTSNVKLGLRARTPGRLCGSKVVVRKTIAV
jgi:hypothetical protein